MTMRERLQNYQRQQRGPKEERHYRIVTVRMSVSLHERLKMRSRLDDASVNRLVILAIEQALTELEQTAVQSEPAA